MKNIAVCILLFLSLMQFTSLAQISGWADSVGYKQQIMKTGAITQVIYSPNGDKLYSVTQDSLWHIHHWDAVTGTLLHVQTFEPLQLKKIYSVVIANDAQTYALSCLQTNDSLCVKIYSIYSDSLLYILPLKIYDPLFKTHLDCSAIFNSKHKVLNFFYHILYDKSSPYGSSGTHNGGVMQYILSDSIPKLVGSVTGGVGRYSLATEQNAVTWIGYYQDVYYYKGTVEINDKWMKSFLWNDTSRSQTDLVFEKTGLPPEIYNSKYAQSYIPIITSDGKQYFFIDHQIMKRWSLSPFGVVSTIRLPFIPTIAISAPFNTHLLLALGRQILLYHIGANVITDSITLPFDFSSIAISPNSTDVVFGSDNGLLRLKKLPFTSPSILDTIRADRPRMYVDSAITFALSTSKIISRYYWDLGDGSTDTNATAIHSYKTPGKYTISLYYTDSSGVSDTIINYNYIEILPQLIPMFSATLRFGKIPLEVRFKDESAGKPNSWKWDFGDETSDSIQNPIHIYTQQKYYHVTLTIDDGLSTLTLKIPYFINGDTVRVGGFTIIKKWLDPAVNKPYKDSYTPSHTYNNTFSKCIYFENSGLYIYRRECYRTGLDGFPNAPINYYPDQSIIRLSSEDKFWKTSGSFGSPSPNLSCDAIYKNPGFQIIKYRDSSFITSFVTIGNIRYPTGGNPDGLLLPYGKFFQPSGWTHDFDGAFLPVGTDIYLFRSQNSSSLQFFRNDSVLIAKDSLIGDVMRPIASADSLYVMVITNPYIGTGDSSRWLIQRTYSSNGVFVNEKNIDKNNRSVRLKDIADIGYGEFLITGWENITDTLGKSITKGYLAKIGSDGRLSWEYTTPIWQSFEKFQRLGSQYYAVWGVPQAGYSQGFIAIQTNGTILSDNRLVGASNAFTPSDFILGNGADEMWFVGSEYIEGQGKRAVAYLCHNPVSSITKIEEIPKTTASNSTITAYPIPASNEIRVQVPILHHGRVEMSFVSSLGIEYLKTYRLADAGISEFHISVRELPVGMYRLCVKTDNVVRFIPVVIIR